MPGKKMKKEPLMKAKSKIDKLKSQIKVEITEYLPNSLVSKTITTNRTENTSIMSSDNGEGPTEKTTLFDPLAQIIEGKAEVVIFGESYIPQPDQSSEIPDIAPDFRKPEKRFKMTLTVI
jgi:hypothetical protein